MGDKNEDVVNSTNVEPVFSSPSNVELGMMFFSNSTIYEVEADWASNGLYMLAHVVKEHRHDESTLTGNHGEQPFMNDVFVLRSYCWCDGEKEGHEEGCPPNFEHFKTGLKISWYKHAGRGITANREEIPAMEWFNIVADCCYSVEGTTVNPAVAERERIRETVKMWVSELEGHDGECDCKIQAEVLQQFINHDDFNKPLL